MRDEKEAIEASEATGKDGCCEQVDPREALIDVYGGLMVKCFDKAESFLLGVPSDPRSGLPIIPTDPRIRSEVALALFNRSTREAPAQVDIMAKALEYLNLMMKDKEAQSEYKPVSLAHFVSSAPPCKHEKLKALREILSDGGDFSPLGDRVMDALSVDIGASTFGASEHPPNNQVVCPECRGIVSVVKFKDGTLWDGDTC